MNKPSRIGVLGAGGLGRSAVRYLEQKEEFTLTAIGDSQGFAWREEGIVSGEVDKLGAGDSVARLAGAGKETADAAGEMIALNREGKLDAIFLAVPNIPNTFIPDLIARFAREGYSGVLADALKRTSAVESILRIEKELRASGVLYVTGAGATPGLLTAAANLAAQSFVRVEEVTIHFGVGIPSWDSYRATVREDIAHMPGYDVEKVRTLSDADIERILDECNGVLHLEDMEHADDVLLERAGVVAAEKVRVGGLVDTRQAKKPVSTTMTLRGTTFEGKESTHRFVLGDETSMAANVLGPAFGWIKAGLDLHGRGIRGLFSSADLMPRFVR